MNKLKINTNKKSYSIYVGNKILKNLGSILKKEKILVKKYFIIYDKNIDYLHIRLIKKILRKKDIFLFKFTTNEQNKSIKSAEKIINHLLKNNFSRNDCIISIGGGILGDLACFAASIYKRGMRFVNIPTTLLAQVDASIGGKSGVNHKLFGKNLIGTFYQPDLVIADVNFLNTLKKKDIICGYAEILKHGLISHKKNFNNLEKDYKNILSLKMPKIKDTIIWSCFVKKKIVEKDEKESNLRKTLNLGHTFGHAYEAAAGLNKRLSHGEGVILGIKSAIKFSLNEKILSLNDYNIINNHIKKLGFNLNLKLYFKLNNIDRIVSFMINDKKNISSKINLVLLKGIGNPIINKKYSSIKIRKFLKKELINL